MNRFSVFLILAFLFQISFSQNTFTTKSKKAIKLYQDGVRAFGLKYFENAEASLNNAIETDQGFLEAYMVLAEVYWEQSKYQEAIHTYSKALDINPAFYPKAFLNKGRLELKTGNYSDALKSYEDYLALEKKTDKGEKQAKKGVVLAKFGVQAVANPVDFDPKTLGVSVNTADDEYWPSLSADGSTLVLTRRLGSHINIRTAQEDFFESIKQDTSWGLAKNMGPPLNTLGNEGAQSISADGKTMVYTVCNQKGVIGRCDLYIAYKQGKVWSKPQNIGRPVNSEAKETQPSLSADGNIIYFSSDRAGGAGKMDLWMSKKTRDGLWQKPVNLGDRVNTSGNEISPFIHFDSQTLYYSSDKHLGLGGYDIFFTRRLGDEGWGVSRNLGYPINTHKDEFGLIVNAKGETAYYATGINEGNGQDIFSFTLYKEARPTSVTYLKGKVFDAESLKRLAARFELLELKTKKIINQSVSDKVTGEFLLCLPANKDYLLNVSRSGYLFFSEHFALKDIHDIEKPFLLDVPLEKIKIGSKIVLRNVFYETDSYELKSESLMELDKVVRFLTINPEVNIKIEGHTDNVGLAAYNLTLSDNRAKSVVDYLLGQGIQKERLSFEGFGLSKPIETNETAAGRAANRRTELRIVE